MMNDGLIDISLLPSPSVILNNLVILEANPNFSKLLPNSKEIKKGTKITELGLFRENQNLLDFISKIENKIDLDDFLLILWNGTIVFATTRNFKRNGNDLILVSFTRFSISKAEDASMLLGDFKYAQDIIDKFEFLIAVHDRNLNFVLCNRNFEKFFGLSRHEIIGKKISEVFGDNEISRLQIETDLELFQGKKQQVHLHLNLSDKNGQMHYLELNKFLINFGGEDFVFCITIDSSELDYVRQLYRESSTLYRALIENAFDAIYLLEGRKYKYVNPRFCELTGYTFEELTSPDFDFEVLIPEESKKFLEERYKARLEGKEIPNQYELQLLHKSGRRVFVEVSTVSVGKPGEVLVMGIMRDITQRKLYEQQLKESEEKLRQMNLAKDKFFNIIAHDLRAPISGLTSMTKLLLENYENLEPEYTKDLLSNILEVSNQTFNLLENLLLWARTQTGTIPFKPEETDLYEVVLASKVLNEPNAKQKGITINNLVPADSFAFVDRNMITTVVRNLISNAVKFSPSNTEITIKLNDIGDFYELIVSDKGVGMTPEQLDKLFKLGENISTVGTQGEKGSGIGLILCQEFVERNGGKIRIESQVGEGTTFFITLPKSKITE